MDFSSFVFHKTWFVGHGFRTKFHQESESGVIFEEKQKVKKNSVMLLTKFLFCQVNFMSAQYGSSVWQLSMAAQFGSSPWQLTQKKSEKK